MKTLSLDKSIRSDPELADAVFAASEILDTVLGSSAGLVEASWRLGHDQRGRTIAVLRLSDWSGFVEDDFAPDEIKNPDQMRRRGVRLWGDLLQIRSHKQIESFASTPAVEEEDALTQIEEAVTEFAEREGREPRLLKLPVRYAVDLMKLGPTFWGEDFQSIRRKGTRAFENLQLLGMRVQLVPGLSTKLELE